MTTPIARRVLVALSLGCVASPASPARAGQLAGELSPYLLERDADAIEWRAWSAATLADARGGTRLLFVLAGRARGAGCPRVERDLLGRADVALTLKKRYIALAVDADEQPDVADLLATMPLALGHEPEAGTGALWALLTPEGGPLEAGRVRDDDAWRASLAATLEALAREWHDARGDVSARAGVALHALRRAQSSEAPLRALDRQAVEHALRGLSEAFDPASGLFGDARHGPLRLLLAESEHGDAAARRLSARAVETLARAQADPCGLPVTEHAHRLRALTRAQAIDPRPATRAAAERAAAALLALRDPAGAFRAAPADTRVFADANGWAIGALALSGSQLERPGDLAAARVAANVVLSRLGPAASLRRVVRDGTARGAALLVDHAALAEGLLDLADVSRDEAPRERAKELVEAALGRFSDARGAFFDAPEAAETQASRPRNGYDGAGLSAQGVFARVLLRLAEDGGEARYRELARATVESFLGDLQRAPRGLETLAAAAAELLRARPIDAPAGATPPPPAPAAVTRGELTATLTLVPAFARAGAAVEARVALAIAGGFSVNAHRPTVPDLTGLSLALLTPELRAGAPVYPTPADVRRRFAARPVAAHLGYATLTLPLRVPAGQAPATLRVRLRLAFQVCDARDCRPPDSLILEAPLEVPAP